MITKNMLNKLVNGLLIKKKRYVQNVVILFGSIKITLIGISICVKDVNLLRLILNLNTIKINRNGLFIVKKKCVKIVLKKNGYLKKIIVYVKNAIGTIKLKKH